MTMTPERARALNKENHGWALKYAVALDAPDLLAGYLALAEENERLRAALASTPVDSSGG